MVEVTSALGAYTELADFQYGHARRIILLTRDEYMTPVVRRHGCYSPAEVEVFRRFARGGLAVEVGANMGVHTLALAEIAGTVVAFEPQRLAFQVLCGNLALNSLANVHALQEAAGAAPGVAYVPLASPWHECNYGGISVQSAPADGCERVRVRTVDSLNLSACDFLKLDCEGSEPDVLLGAAETIRAYGPAIYLEFDRADNRERIQSVLTDFGYCAWRHFPRHAPDSNIVSDMVLALPSRWSVDSAFLARLQFSKIRPTAPATVGASAEYRRRAGNSIERRNA